MSWNKRKTTFIVLLASVCFLLVILIAGALCTDAAMVTDFSRKNKPPSLRYLFGTDFLGRDMFLRTLTGLSMSIRLGVVTASVSALFAFLLGASAAYLGKAADAVISFVIDLCMGIPHILLLILIAFACGKGFGGVVFGIIFTHWMSLARVMRGEILQLKQSGFVAAAGKMGAGKWRIVTRHMLPHLLPQFLIGLILLFPHAILHEASITFLGFGLPPEQPAIGIILSESMKYLITGNWWLAVFPGASLVLVVALFDFIGGAFRKLFDPASAHD